MRSSQGRSRDHRPATTSWAANRSAQQEAAPGTNNARNARLVSIVLANVQRPPEFADCESANPLPMCSPQDQNVAKKSADFPAAKGEPGMGISSPVAAFSSKPITVPALPFLT